MTVDPFGLIANLTSAPLHTLSLHVELTKNPALSILYSHSNTGFGLTFTINVAVLLHPFGSV